MANNTLAGAVLRTKRRRIGMSQRELAQLTGLPLQTICDIEQGRWDDRRDTFGRINRALMDAPPRETPEGEEADVDVPDDGA